MKDDQLNEGASGTFWRGRITRAAAVAGSRRGLVLGLVVALIVGGGLAWWLLHDGSDLPDGAVMVIDGDVISAGEYDARLQILEGLYGVEPPKEKEAADGFRRDAAKSMAVSRLLADAAEGRGVEIPEDQVRQALDAIVAQQLPEGRAGFIQFLEETHLTEEEVLEEVRLQLATSALFDSVTAEVRPPTSTELTAEFERRKDELRLPEMRRIANIVVPTEEEAQQVRTRLARGEAFAAVAREVSLDGSTREKGGDLGLVRRDDLLPGFADAAFETPVGGLFGPVQSDYGWNVGKVGQVRQPRALSFAAVRKDLTAQVQDERRYALWRDWLAGVIGDAEVRYADAYRPADPDAPPSEVSSEVPTAP